MELENDICIIYVHFKTPKILNESLTSLLANHSKSRNRIKVLIIDNSCDLLSPQFDSNYIQIITPKENLGYAGAINLGVRSILANKYIIMNPDVIPLEGCIDQLSQALDDYDVVAPNLFLDRKLMFRLPPIESNSFLALLITCLGKKRPLFKQLSYMTWRKHAEQYWDSKTAFVGYELSGAIIGFTRQAFELAGLWDDRFFLYFEETDWLVRVKKRGLRAAYVPQAKAIHLYSQSTSKNPDANDIYVKSKNRFLNKHFNKIQIGILSWIENRIRKNNAKRHESNKYIIPETPMSLELSYSSEMFPAARAYIQNPAIFENGLPEYITEQLHTTAYNLHWITSQGTTYSKARFQLDTTSNSFKLI